MQIPGQVKVVLTLNNGATVTTFGQRVDPDDETSDIETQMLMPDGSVIELIHVEPVRGVRD